jgi:hypothetical protein
LVHLKKLTNLSKLDLRFTQVTDAGVNDLKQALSNLTINHRVHGFRTVLASSLTHRQAFRLPAPASGMPPTGSPVQVPLRNLAPA